MKFLLGLSIAIGVLILFIPAEETLVFGYPFVAIAISTMIYFCYKKLQSIEAKFDEMNEKDKTENNNKE